MFTTNATMKKLKMSFSKGTAGWSEALYFPAVDNAVDIALAQTLVQYRLAILPQDMELDVARISTVGGRRDRHIVSFDRTLVARYPGFFVAPATEAPEGHLTCNDPENAVAMELESGEGDWATRFIHGVPDAFVVSNALTDDITTPTGSVPPIGDGTFSTNWFTRVGYYLNRVKALTLMDRKQKISGVWVYYSNTIYAAFSGGLTRHKVGAPFGQPVGRARPH